MAWDQGWHGHKHKWYVQPGTAWTSPSWRHPCGWHITGKDLEAYSSGWEHYQDFPADTRRTTAPWRGAWDWGYWFHLGIHDAYCQPWCKWEGDDQPAPNWPLKRQNASHVPPKSSAPRPAASTSSPAPPASHQQHDTQPPLKSLKHKTTTLLPPIVAR